jgi:hypothetical protein
MGKNLMSVWEIRNPYESVLVKPERQYYSEDLGIDGIVIKHGHGQCTKTQ